MQEFFILLSWRLFRGQLRCRMVKYKFDKPNILSSSSLFGFFIYLLLFKFCTLTNKCTIISQFITLHLHVSTLLCHPQSARSFYLAKLHNYVNAVVVNTIQNFFFFFFRRYNFIVWTFWSSQYIISTYCNPRCS